jgi:hypothetical protein
MNTMLISFRAPQNLWGEEMLTFNYILNNVHHKKLGRKPYKLWKGKKSSYKCLKMWGCLIKVAIPNLKKVKIWIKIMDYVFLEYADNNNTYWFLIYK